MTFISLDRANAIIAGALAKARDMNLNPMGVAVLDAGGHLIAFQREDGSPSIRLTIASAKAGGALAMGVSSRRIGELAIERPGVLGAIAAIAPQGMVPAAGAVLVLGADGRPIGAVGVTGDTSDNDEVCAIAGIAAAGLKTQE